MGAYIESYGKCALIRNCDEPPLVVIGNCRQLDLRIIGNPHYSAAGLTTTKLATFLEDRVNNYLRTVCTEHDGAGRITIRVVSSSDKTLETRMLMKERFGSDFPAQFPYRTKAMFVFEEIDGVDVCFFGMHVQEYGSDCQAPNTRCVAVFNMT